MTGPRSVGALDRSAKDRWMPNGALTLRDDRLRAGPSRCALARRACMDASDAHRLERVARRAPALEVALTLARALELSPDEINRLVWPAGTVPSEWRALDPGDGAPAAVPRLLADPGIPASAGTDRCLVIQASARHGTSPAAESQTAPAGTA